MELKAYQAYRNPELDIRYWRTSSGLEVDFVLGDMDVAVEVKGSKRIHTGDTRGLRALLEEHQARRAVVVSMEPVRRTMNSVIEIYPWQSFLDALWAGDLGV